MGKSRILVFNSIDVIEEDPTNKPEDFIARFSPEILLDYNKEYEIALNHLSMSASWYNIRPEYNNNKLKISKDKGRTYQTITFPSGVYDYEDINRYIHKTIGPLTRDSKEYGINISFDLSTYKVFIQLSTDYYIDFTTGSSGYFKNLLGFESKVLTSSEYGKNFPNITNSIDILNLRCDLLSESIISGKRGDVLFTFATNTKVRSLPFEIHPVNRSWHKINRKVISNVRFYLADGKGKIIDLNGQDVHITIELKEV